MTEKEPKHPDDFPKWRQVACWRAISGGNYIVIDSPDGREEACVHVDDGDVLGIMDELTGRYRYETSELRLALLGRR